MNSTLEYRVPRAATTPSLRGNWEEPAWRAVPVAEVNRFLKQSSDHHPRTEAKLTYAADGLYVFFRVFDRYVICTHTEFQSAVCKDSCVEFFVQPKPDKGYFNFETNCGGTLLVYYIENPARVAEGFKQSTPLPWELAKDVTIFHSQPRTVSPEIAGPVEWTVEYRIPWRVLETYVGPLGDPAGQVWRGNLYKCASDTSHPHWASWAPLTEALNFHLPECFAPLRLQ